MTQSITLMPGDGIGPEVTKATVRVIDAMNLGIRWDYQRLGKDAGGELPQATLDSIARNKVALKGPTETPPEGHRSYNVALRETFLLYANVRPVVMLPRVRSRYADLPLDMVLFRENLEDLYIGEERDIKGGAEAISRITVKGTRQIAAYAFDYARTHGRRKMTVIVKHNILKKTHGLFLAIAREVALDYPEIECDYLIADNALQQLIMRPERFDMLLLPNFLGDLFSDACAALCGGLGFAPGANIGKDHALFEAVHGTAPDIAGRGIANPSAMMLSGAMMLDHIGEHVAADRIRSAIRAVLKEGKCLTGDIARENPVSTDVFTDAVITRL